MPETPLPSQRKGLIVPEKIEEYLDDPGTEDAILDILMRHQIKERAGIEDAVDAIVDVLEGKLHPNDLIQKLAKTTSLSQGQAQQLAVDISKKIFTPVRDELLTMYRGPSAQRLTSNLEPVTGPMPTAHTAQPASPAPSGGGQITRPTSPASELAGGRASNLRPVTPTTPARQPITSNLRPVTPFASTPAMQPIAKPLAPPSPPAGQAKPLTPPPSSSKSGDATSTARLVTPKPFVPSAPFPPPPSNAPKPFTSPTPTSAPTLQPKQPVSPPPFPPPAPNRGVSPPPATPAPPPKPPTPPDTNS